MRVRREAGVLILPLGVALVLLGLMALGTLGFMRNWRKLMETQLRLDRCVGEVALDLRNVQNSLEAANLRMKVLRASIAAATVPSPPVAAALKRALELQALLENLTLKKWELRRIKWLVLRGCDSNRDLPRPLPNLPWIHDPPDPIGARPLRWPLGVQKEYYVQLSHSPRHAAASVSKERNAVEILKWSARWAPPRIAF